jgi:hypothetical protein
MQASRFRPGQKATGAVYVKPDSASYSQIRKAGGHYGSCAGSHGRSRHKRSIAAELIETGPAVQGRRVSDRQALPEPC